MNFNLSKITQKGFVNILITIGSMAISFIISIVLSNLFSSEVYGDYVFVFSWIEIISMFSLLGLNQLLTIYVPKYLTDNLILSYIFKKYLKIVIVLSIIFSVISFSISFLNLPFFTGENTRFFFRYGSLIIPFFSISLFRHHFLINLKHVILAQFPEKILKPLLFLATAILIYYLNLKSTSLIIAYYVSIISTFILGFYFLFKKFRITKNLSSAPIELPYLKEGFYFLIIINLINFLSNKIDVIMIGSLSDIVNVGIYNILFKLSSFITLSLAAIRIVIAPNISELISNKNFAEARTIIKQSSRISLVLGIICFILIFIFKTPIFNLFNVDSQLLFDENIWSFYLLSIMQLISLTVGPVASILLISKSFKPLLTGQFISTISNILLNYFLIPKFGINGAALSTLISVFLWYTYLIIINYSKKNINPTAFGK